MNLTTASKIAAFALPLSYLSLAAPPALSLTFTLEEATITSINAAYDAGIINSQQLVQLYLNRIDAYDKQGPKINSIISLNPNALTIAADLDLERRLTGARSPLHGIPILLKDNYNTFDLPTTAGTTALAGFTPATDAFQVDKLRDAGAIILGKVNLSEFAFSGSTSISSLGGQTVNPYDPLRSPAGSSGGTGAAIAANFAVLGMGTDTGGSIRNPASFNGLVGVRPTIGLSSREGIVPLALSQDVGGPLTRTVWDAALTLDYTVGYDPSDPITINSVGKIPDSYTTLLSLDGLQGKKIGVVRDLFGLDTNPESALVNQSINEAIATMEGLGATFVDVTIPNLAQIFSYPSLSAYEFKFDLNDYLTTYGAPYQSLTAIINSGQFLPSNLGTLNSRNSVTDLATNATYQNIIAVRPGLTQSSLLTALNGLDALLYPTSTGLPRLNSQGQQIGANNRLSAFSGFPALTLPAGFTTATPTIPSLPVGMEFLGRAFSEPLLLQLAYAYEQAALVRTAPTFTPPLPGETITVPEPHSWAGFAALGIGAIALKLTQKPKIKS